MAPNTRAKDRFTPPPGPEKGYPATTRKRMRFFDAYDRDHATKPVSQICLDEEVKESTGRYWLRQRRNLGHLAMRRTRKLSDKLGMKSKVTKSMCKMLVDPKQNPVRDQLYEAQIQFHNIPVQKRQLQRKLKEHTQNARRYKMAFVKKKVLAKNKEERMAYGVEHKDDTIDDYWSHICFTDEAHVDPKSQRVGEILREEGHRYDDENIMEREERQGIAFHVAAWISWHGKAEKLEFYNDEEDTTEHPPMPPKPRRRPTTESEAEYQERLKEWEAQKPHVVEKKVSGNHMTQKYYTERLLPIYIHAVQIQRAYDSSSWYLQEDGDPSHGMRKAGLAQALKDQNYILNIKHPAQSPDLNPIEGIWNIIKQRLRRRVFYTDEEVKAALQEEWDKITLEEIRKRIRTMPKRCKRLTENGGKAIKTALW
jgi:hypothetical protein